jgi:hypothetical protein
MQQKIAIASIITLMAMLFVMAAWDGSPPASDDHTADAAGQTNAVAQSGLRTTP